MTFAMIAATALLGTVGQPSEPTVKVGVGKVRTFHWMLVPGGGVFPVPTPFVFLVPLGRLDEMKIPVSAKARNELHIVIQSEKDGVITETFAKKIVSGLKQMIEDAQQAEDEAAAAMTAANPVSKVDCKKSDPKAVIDPIVTGF